jgi:hypothetical protein
MYKNLFQDVQMTSSSCDAIQQAAALSGITDDVNTGENQWEVNYEHGQCLNSVYTHVLF